jgi:hypothetical protein
MARPMANDPPFAILNHFAGDLGIPRESDSLRIGIITHLRNFGTQLSSSSASSSGSSSSEVARTVATMKAGRARWLAKLKSEGKPIPCGRKKGGRNLPAEERTQLAYERRSSREARDMVRQMRAERKTRRTQEREETRRKMEEHTWRKARMDAGLPYWTPEEWENL